MDIQEVSLGALAIGIKFSDQEKGSLREDGEYGRAVLRQRPLCTGLWGQPHGQAHRD